MDSKQFRGLCDGKKVLADSNVKLQKIGDTLKESKECVDFILREHLSTSELFSKWVPRLFTVEQKQQFVDYSESYLWRKLRFAITLQIAAGETSGTCVEFGLSTIFKIRNLNQMNEGVKLYSKR